METQTTDLFAQPSSEQETEVLTAVVIEDQKTSEVAKIVKESGIEQTKGQMILQSFVSFFNGMAEIEAEIKALNKENPTKEDSKKAYAIRQKLKKSRCAAKETKEDLEEGLKIEVKVINSVYKTGEGMSQLLELECETIEKHEENLEKKRKEALRLERIELLQPFGVDVSFINLSEMPQEKFDELYENSKFAYEGRLLKEKMLKEEKERNDNRIKLVSSMGFRWNDNENSFLYGDFNVSMTDIKCDDDTAFNEKIESIKVEMQRREKEAADAKIISDRIEERVNQLSSLGMKYNDLEQRYEYDEIDGEEMSIKLESLKNDGDDLFEVQMVACKATIDMIEENKATLAQLGKERQQLMFDIGVNVFAEDIAKLDTDEFNKYHAEHLVAYKKKLAEDRVAAENAEIVKKNLILLQAKEQAIKTKAENFGKRLVQEFGYKKDGSGVVYSKQGYDVTVEKLKQLTDDEFLQRINEVDEKIKAEKAAKKALQAPDKQKVKAFLKQFSDINSIDVKDEAMAKIVKDCLDLRDKIVVYGNEKLEAL